MKLRHGLLILATTLTVYSGCATAKPKIKDEPLVDKIVWERKAYVPSIKEVERAMELLIESSRFVAPKRSEIFAEIYHRERKLAEQLVKGGRIAIHQHLYGQLSHLANLDSICSPLSFGGASMALAALFPYEENFKDGLFFFKKSVETANEAKAAMEAYGYDEYMRKLRTAKFLILLGRAYTFAGYIGKFYKDFTTKLDEKYVDAYEKALKAFGEALNAGPRIEIKVRVLRE